MAYRQNPPTIPLAALEWEPTGADKDPEARLVAHLKIGDLDMNLEAWAVFDDSAGNQLAHTETMRVFDLDSLQTMEECQFSTTTINGREYILIALPYGR